MTARAHIPAILPWILPSLLVASLGTAGCGGHGGYRAASQGTPTPTPPAGSVNVETGLPVPDNLYVDLGPADPSQGFRALISFKLPDRAGLEAVVASLYDPASPTFRQYLGTAGWSAAWAPSQADVDATVAWLESGGMQVPVVAKNRLLLEFTGTVDQFDAAFGAQLHQLQRGSDVVYGRVAPLRAPAEVASHFGAVVFADLPASSGALPPDTGSAQADPPGNGALAPADIAAAYGADSLLAAGSRGAGSTIGVVVGATFRRSDVKAFWASFGISRGDPLVVDVAEAPATRYLESTLDVEWSGAMAPDAELIVFEGPDKADTSVLLAFDEAIGSGAANVITDSFAHREDSERPALRRAYDDAALQAAALGISVVAASGDSGKPDVPSSSPYVTAVGGTVLVLNPDRTIASEEAWQSSGSGSALTFPRPSWQAAVAPGDSTRAVCDVALNAATPYWARYLGAWGSYGGTSFASPVFAGIVAVANSARSSSGAPAAGWLNPALYGDSSVRASFHDVTSGATGDHSSGAGWDYPTGWGSPDAGALAHALP